MSFRCETNARKLLIIQLSEPRPYALLPGIVLSFVENSPDSDDFY
jgi:hypothetical protein